MRTYHEKKIIPLRIMFSSGITDGNMKNRADAEVLMAIGFNSLVLSINRSSTSYPVHTERSIIRYHFIYA